jgi:hypothetical protein
VATDYTDAIRFIRDNAERHFRKALDGYPQLEEFREDGRPSVGVFFVPGPAVGAVRALLTLIAGQGPVIAEREDFPQNPQRN